MAHSRPHGRSKTEPREINITYDGLARSDGSARFGFGQTSALATISGPIEVRLAAENPSQTTFEVHLRPLTNVPGTEAKALGAHIRSALSPSLILTQNPRSLVQLSVQALSSPGGVGGGYGAGVGSWGVGKGSGQGKWKDGLTSAMINASSCALLNAGSVPMRGVVCAISIGAVLSPSPFANWTYLVDPEDDEIKNLNAGGCFAFLFAETLPGGAECVWTSWRTFKGGVDVDALKGAREVALDAARGVLGRVRESVGTMGARRFRFDEGMVKRDVGKGVEKMDEGSEEDGEEDKMEI